MSEEEAHNIYNMVGLRTGCCQITELVEKYETLQQENIKLKEKDYNHFAYLKRIDNLQQEKKELKERIERALKYKNNEIYYCLSSGDDITIYLDMLDDILMGVEK